MLPWTGRFPFMPQETWTARDLPVLEAIVEAVDGGARHVESARLVEQTGLDAEDVRQAIVALAHEDPPFFEFTDFSSLSGPTELGAIRNLTGHARRTVGTWPTAETLADRLIEEIQQAADDIEDPEEAGRLRRTGQWFSAAGRDVLVNIISTAITGS